MARVGGVSRLPEFNGVAARISAADISKHRGQFVTLVCRPVKLTEAGNILLVEIASEQNIELCEYPPTVNDSLSHVNEFVCYINPTNAAVMYHSHGTFNDEFDADAYRKLLGVISKHHHLFY